MEERTCENCGKIYRPRRAAQKYCSAECRDAQTYTATCLVCGKLISRRYLSTTRICSPECYRSWRTLLEKKSSGGPPRRDGKPSLADIVLEAAEHGMSYGQYVATLK